MNHPLKLLVSLMLSSGLVACATTPLPAEPEKNATPPVAPVVEAPKVIVDENAPLVETLPRLEPAHSFESEVKDDFSMAKHTSDGKIVLGDKEWVYLPGLKESFKARIDTGATTSSISAVDIVTFERSGQDWVKFRIEHDNVRSEEISLPVERWVRIRQSSAEKPQRRAVVMAWIQIGDLKEYTEFTLTDRTHLTYPLLLGRSFFKDVAVVDVSRHYIQEKFSQNK
ncbi:ATP-dependent zinc protease [Vibrio metoecus]|uniref:Ribosomal protein S6 modification protein n=1 Tax=Vibrio metoecus TaxID=1481663 RepID=A0ABR4RWC3_VIBMT|nr:ATP-dependent zinc protease [Vibrio sp. AH4]KDO14014.1 ribosomal protein S6 modification protein [Vibrio metoecus]MDP4493935.1 ATP-dependent zinc protease [Vibrio sp. AH4]